MGVARFAAEAYNRGDGARKLLPSARPKYNPPPIFQINMGAGHGGAFGRYDALREAAFDCAFMLTEMGVGQQPSRDRPRDFY